MKFLENEYGFYYQSNDHLVFFGKTLGTAERIKLLFPQFEFLRVKQTHSDICIQSSNTLTEADAHFTNEKNKALLIATADCVPLMVFCQQTGRVAAIHAGWKGVANQITVKTILSLIKSGSSDRNFIFYFGPHILQQSFEVSKDVYELLSSAQFSLKPEDFAIEANGKYYVDLMKILISQIEMVTQTPAHYHSISLDTKTNDYFFSYRRGKMTQERNLSFIAKV